LADAIPKLLNFFVYFLHFPYLSSAPTIDQTSWLADFFFQILRFLIKTTVIEPKTDGLIGKTGQLAYLSGFRFVKI
jgi:hypothetical protein